MRAEHTERFRDFLHQIERIHSDNLSRSASRIRKRSKKVEDSAQPGFAAHWRNIFGCGMDQRSKQERNSDFVQTSSQEFWCQLNIYSQRFHNIGGAAFRAQFLSINSRRRAAVAV